MLDTHDTQYVLSTVNIALKYGFSRKDVRIHLEIAEVMLIKDLKSNFELVPDLERKLLPK